jgi:myo-inositol-1-phosphate synthase
MVHPNDLVISGWDISGSSLDKAMHYDLQGKSLLTSNQEERVDNLIPGSDKRARLEQIRADIRTFNELDRIIVFWTANTKRYRDIIPSVSGTADNLLNTIKTFHAEVSPSTLFAVAAILEGEPFISGAPQNTFVPGAIQVTSLSSVVTT